MNDSDYMTQHNWPKNCNLRYGHKSSTNFFEVMLKNSHVVYIKEEGRSIKEAEKKAWNKYQLMSKCRHTFERKSYKSGVGICRQCGGIKFDVFRRIEETCPCKDSKRNCFICKGIGGVKSLRPHDFEKKDEVVFDILLETTTLPFSLFRRPKL